jgi:putative endonuclease
VSVTQLLASGWVSGMFYIYLLKNVKGTIYIGYTNNLRRRLREHRAGKTYTTKRMKSTDLVYYEAYPTELAAKEREKKLKQFGSSYHGLVKRLKI